MSIFTKLAQDVFAGFTSAGQPRQIIPLDAARWGTEMERVIDNAFTSGSSILFLTKASMDASLASPAATLAWVIADPVAANNGIYQKTGASGTGSWIRVADLPYSFIRLTDAGAGTANAIQLTSSLPTSPSVLRVANVFEPNTGNVTISENGGAFRSLRTNSGNQIAPGGLVAGGMIAYVDDGTNFRLLSDQASAAIQAAAEAAAAAAAISEDNAADSAADAAASAASAALITTALPRINLAALKALDTTAITVAYRTDSGKQGMFTWRAGDYSAQIAADTLEAIYIKANAIAATAGAWVRTDGGWALQGADVRWFGVTVGVTATRADAVNNSTRHQAAIDLNSAGHIPAVRVPGGLIEYALSQTPTLEGGASYAALVAKTKLVMRGAGSGVTILKVRDGESTDGAPLYWNFMAGNTVIQDLILEGFTVDLNGENNDISPNRSVFFEGSTIFNGTPGFIQTTTNHGLAVNDPVRFWVPVVGDTLGSPLVEGTTYYVKAVTSATVFTIAATVGGAEMAIGLGDNPATVEAIGSYNHFNCAALMVSGRVATVGVDARIERGKICNVEVKNCPGVTAIALGQQEAIATHSHDVEITGCRFYNMGFDSSDHSSVYMWGDRINVHHNLFYHPVPSFGIGGPVCAFETHGNDNRFTDNIVINYLQGGWICSDQRGTTGRVQVNDNIFFVTHTGVGFWTIAPLDEILRDVEVCNNVFEVQSGKLKNINLIGFTKMGISCNAEDAGILNVKIADNIIRTFDQTTNLGIFLSSGAGTSAARISITDNIISGFSVGIGVGYGSAGTIEDFILEGNEILDCRTTVAIPANTRAIVVSGTTTKATIVGNAAGGGDTAPAIGVYLTGTIGSLHMDGNDLNSAAAGKFDDAVSTKRSGMQATLFANLTALATQWTAPAAGDFAWCSDGTELGAAASKYTLSGWRYTGSAWLERRELTGN